VLGGGPIRLQTSTALPSRVNECLLRTGYEPGWALESLGALWRKVLPRPGNEPRLFLGRPVPSLA
jgi:hypothetical protein